MPGKKGATLALLVLVSAIVLSACQARSKQVEVTRVVVETVVETVFETVVETVVAQQTVLETVVVQVTDEPQRGERTLVLCQGQEPTTLYAYGGSELAAAHILEAIYDGPFDTRAFGYQAVILEKMPSLADGDAIIETVTVQTGDLVVDDSVNPAVLEEGVLVRPAGCYATECAVEFDGQPLEMERMAVTFKLLEGIQWSDGEPLTAYDSVYAWDLQADPDTPQNKYTHDRSLGYEALDDYTVVWTGLPGYRDPAYYANFWSPLPEHLWGEFTALELLEAVESTRSPIGWGAFVIDEWVAGEHITLHRNENYWRADEGLPRFERVVVRFVGTNSNANVAALLSGECDVVDQTSNLDEQAELLLELDASGQINATFVSGTEWEHADFCIVPAEDYVRPDFFGDVRTRQAIAHCMDRQAVVDSALYGQSVVPDTFVSPAHPLFNADAPRYEFDVARGAQLLDAVGWIDDDADPSTPRVALGVQGVSDGTLLEFNYWTTNSTQRQLASQVLQDSLAQCGIKINLEYWNDGLFDAGPQGAIFGRRFDMAQFAFNSGLEPPCWYFLSSSVPGPPEEGYCGWNCPGVSGWSDSEYDQVCGAAMQALPGTPEYEQYHREAQRVWAENLPLVPLYMRLKLAATRADMQGFVMDATQASEMWNIEEFDY